MAATEQNNPVIACTLTKDELQQRKASLFTTLKQKALERKELKDGFASRFEYTDEMLATLEEFIRTEKECCSFFEFNLAETEDKRFLWLEVKGPQGVKEFIKAEMGL